jgi:hypothetical protein
LPVTADGNSPVSFSNTGPCLNVTPIPTGSGPFTALEINPSFGGVYLIEYLFTTTSSEGSQDFECCIDVNSVHQTGSFYTVTSQELGISPLSGVRPTLAGQIILNLNALDKVSLFKLSSNIPNIPPQSIAGEQLASISIKRID